MLKMTIKAIWGAAHDHSMYTQKAQEVFEDFEKNVKFWEISFVGLCLLGAHTGVARSDPNSQYMHL